jgi:hypothetical protein
VTKIQRNVVLVVPTESRWYCMNSLTPPLPRGKIISGVEGIAVVGLIDAYIGITKTILDIGRAVRDA